MVASRAAARATLAVGLTLALPVSAGADTAEQVLDLNPGLAWGVNDVAHGAATFAGQLYFAGQSSANDVELWRYDGVNPPIEAFDLNAAVSSDPSEPTAFGALLCFSAHDAAFDRELYCYDNATPPWEIEINPTGSSNPMNYGVAAPAAAVASFAGASDFPLNGFEASAGLLYFAARHDTGGGGEELWALTPDEAPPSTGSAMWQPDSYVVFEESLATLTLVRTGDTSGPLTVEVRTVDGTASVFGPGFADYLTYINSVTWDAGDASPRQITIEIGGDGGTNDLEGPEEFHVELYQPSILSGNLVDTATVTILDTESVSEIPALDGPGLLALIALLGAAAFAFLRRA